MGWMGISVLASALALPTDSARVSCDLAAPIAGPHVCLTVPVREGPGGRTIDLFVMVAEATGPERQPDPVYWIAGGPGQPASAIAPFLAEAFGEIRKQRDLVFVDPRGSGRSSPLVCPPLGDPDDIDTWMREFLDPARFRACRPALEEKADLTRYTTAILADDLDVVREALGHEEVNLIGGSYGTRVALEYLRRHEERVRSALLEGVTFRLEDHLLTQAELLERGLRAIVAQCRADPGCAEVYPTFETDLDAVLSRLDEGPIETTATNPMTGLEEPVSLTRESFVYALRFSLYYSGPASELPRNIVRAARGDWTPFVRMAIDLAHGFSTMAGGMNMSVRCAEVVPYTDPEEARRRARGTVFGTLRLEQERAICADWPRGTIPEDFRDPIEADAPVLMLSGEWDITTPPEEGEYAAGRVANARFVPLANTRHDIGSAGACIDRIRREFIETGDWRGLDLSCAAQATHPPFDVGGDAAASAPGMGAFDPAGEPLPSSPGPRPTPRRGPGPS